MHLTSCGQDNNTVKFKFPVTDLVLTDKRFCVKISLLRIFSSLSQQMLFSCESTIFGNTDAPNTIQLFFSAQLLCENIIVGLKAVSNKTFLSAMEVTRENLVFSFTVCQHGLSN